MALAVAHTGGNVTSAADTITSDSWSSTAGSLIVAVGQLYNNASSPAAGDITDSKGNSYSLGPADYDGANALGIGVWYNNDGTRGASHTVTFDPVGVSTEILNIAVIEITGQDLTAAVFDTDTDALANDATSPFDVTAAAAISGNQIAIYGVVLDVGTNNAWTQPSGYADIINQPNGITSLVSLAAYKLNETGTPTVGASSAHTPAAAKEVFATFKEAVTAVSVAWITA